ncbi:MAG: hypothetical protein EAZ11_11310 [Curvibacter sp.]|nr:MAG: hypothetical protein EAZ11_11310 [Curvibacter sp.]
MTVHVRGDWNLEMISQTTLQMRQHGAQLNEEGPWGILYYLHDTLVYSEAVYAQTRQDYAARSPQSKLCAVAFVIGPLVEGAKLFKPRFESLLEGVIAARVFADDASARQWLHQKISGA